MAPKLTEGQKDLLRWFVQETRAGRLKDEFWVVLALSGSHVRGGANDRNDIERSTLEALRAAGYLLAYERQRGFITCMLTGDAFAAVESDFAPEPPPPTHVTYNQQGQTVQYQYNAGHNINISAVQNKVEFVQQLQNIVEEINRAAEANVIDGEVAVEAEAQIKKAIIEVNKDQPSKAKLTDYFGKAKDLFTDVTAAAGLVKALLEASEVAGRIFQG